MKKLTSYAVWTAKDIAYISVMTALLIGGQFALSFTYGLEIVTVLLLCFSYVFGVRRGMLTATAFSLLRCFVFGFYPTVLMLYLIYYNLFALLCGLCGRIKNETFQGVVFHLLFLLLMAGCAYFLIQPLAVTALKRKFVQIFFCVLFCLFAAALVGYDLLFLKKKGGKIAQTVLFMTAIACFSTVCFTLIDDVVTPLFFGYTSDAAYAYFVASFLAMLPQTACSFATVCLLFVPITKIFDKFLKTFDKRGKLC